MPNLTRAIVVGFVTLAGLHSGQASAAEDREGNPIVLLELTPQRLNPLGMRPVDAITLGTKRGGNDVANEMILKGVVADNRAVNVATGNNVIADGAFTAASGMPMVIQNSGNNVLIQNATIVNIQVK